MKALSLLLCSAVMLAASVGVASADDPASDQSTYRTKMHDCAAQMKTDHPEMNHTARRKACREQLGPAPKAAPAAGPVKATPRGMPPAMPTSPQTDPTHD